ncbi:MAG: hypothetical protein ABI855_04845 [Bacteroidota bacterium]
MQTDTATTAQIFYSLEHDGKQLSTIDEQKNWYENKIKKEKKSSPDFSERKFAEAERTNIENHVHVIVPTDTESRTFKKTLFDYLIKVVYNSLHTVLYPVRMPQDIFMGHLSWFDRQFEQIKDGDEQKKFIEKEMERVERNNKDWEHSEDATDPIHKYVLEAGKMFFNHLKLKLTNYQHSQIASGHEPLIEQFFTSNYGLGASEEMLLPEVLENRLIIEGVGYKRALSDSWKELKFDEEYFRKFIPNRLMNEFVESIFIRIERLNNHEINKFLTLSIAQFDQFNPVNRKKEFIQKFAEAYWHPNHMEKISETEERAANYILNDFIPFYPRFKEAVEKFLSDFRSGLLGSGGSFSFPPPALQVQNQKLKTNLSQDQLVTLFKMLSELKPDIFETKTETELFRFIAANFETKRQSELSEGSIKNSFYAPEAKSADFWQKHLHTMLALVKKYKGF